MTNQTPRISVITIVRNAEKTLEKAITSVLMQNYSNLEYIIIDGNSTDRTVEIIKSYSGHLAYWHSRPDRGGNDAYNLGLQNATGDIVTFLNADDWYEPNTLNAAAMLFTENDQPDIIISHARIVTQTKYNTFKTLKSFDRAEQLELNLSNLLFGTPLINARFFKRTFLEKIGPFNALDSKGNYLISADRELLLRAYLTTSHHAILPQLGYVYLAHPDSQTMSNNRLTLIKVLKEHLQICKDYLNSDKLTAPEKKIMRAWRTDQLRRLIIAYLKSFQFKNALKTAAQLI